jgi:hypothetical protein
MATFLIVSFVVVALAAAAQAIAGFGFALLAVPVLALVADAPTAVVGTSVVGLIPLLVNVVRDRRYAAWRTAAAMCLAAGVGLPLGLLILRGVPERGLTALIAVVVLGCTAIVWRPPRLARVHPALIGAVGVLTGVLTTSTGTNGPPLVASFHAMGYGHRALRATVAAVFLGTGVLAAVGFVIAGAVTPRAALLAAVGVPAALAGWFAGNHLFARLDPDGFRRVLLGALATCGALAVARVIAW